MSVNERHDISNSQSNSNISCNLCRRGFTTNRGLLLHLSVCQRKQQEQQNQQLDANDDQENTHQLQDMPLEPINESFYWDEKPGTTVVKELNNTTHCLLEKKHVFLPTGAAGESLINKIM